MNIRQLEVFCVVCREMSFTKAGNKLYLTQPAVSHVVRELEIELGIRLFDRISRKVFLTEPGEAFYKKASGFLDMYEELISFKERGQAVSLRVGSTITTACGKLPDLMADFIKENPKVNVSVKVASAAAIYQALLNNELDIGLIEGEFKQEFVQREEIGSYQIGVFSAPFFAREEGEVSFQTLASYPLLLREKGSAIRDALDAEMLSRHLYVSPLWESVNSQALIAAAKKGLGAAVLPFALVKEELEKGDLCEIPLEGGPIVNKEYIAYHKEKYVSFGMRAFISFINGTEWNGTDRIRDR